MSILFPDQVVPFLLHDDRIVREHALRYFVHARKLDWATADQYWQMLDRFNQADGWFTPLPYLSEAKQTESSYARLLHEIGQKPPESKNLHLQHAISDLDFLLLKAHADEVLNCDAIIEHVREHLRQRLSLAETDPQTQWDSLMEFGRELGDTYAYQFDHRRAERLIEAATRHPTSLIEQAMRMLKEPAAQEDWREIFAVQFLGAVRCESAIDELILKFDIDTDVLRERVSDALTNIGTIDVIRKIEAFHPGKRWDVRLYADDPMNRIKMPESELALLRLLDHEPAEDLRLHLLFGLTELGSLEGLDLSREMIAEDPGYAECLDLASALLAVSAMHGTELEEAEEWRRAIEHRERKNAERTKAHGSLDDSAITKSMRDHWMATGIQFPPSDRDESEFDDDDSEIDLDLLSAASSPASMFGPRDSDIVMPIIRMAPKISRNDPCPCGSGKKYKKCCGK